MQIDVYSRGQYKIIKIKECQHVISELTELKSIIEGYLENGNYMVAVNFAEASYLYSGAISVLISCYKMVKNHHGDLCIVEPKHELLELLRQMNIDSIIDIYENEDQLPQKK
jgi:anti-anti-sigma factor